MYWKYLEVKQRLSRSIMSSVGSGSSTIEFLIAFSVLSSASWSHGILVNSDFTSKDTSLWSSGICIVLMASIKFSVDCSLCLDSSVRGHQPDQPIRSTNQINNHSITEYHQLTWYNSLTLKMTTAQVVETSVTVNNNSPIQDYVHQDDQTQPTFEMTPRFKPFTIIPFTEIQIS